ESDERARHAQSNPLLGDHQAYPASLHMASLGCYCFLQSIEDFLGDGVCLSVRLANRGFEGALAVSLQPDFVQPLMFIIDGLQVHAGIFARIPTPVIAGRDILENDGHGLLGPSSPYDAMRGCGYL